MAGHTPVKGGEELQITAGDQQLTVILDDVGQALKEEALLTLLPSIEGNALCILPHPHKPVPVPHTL